MEPPLPGGAPNMGDGSSAAMGTKLSQYMNGGAGAIFVYDILLTLDEEVDHVWSRLSFDLPTVLYMINRYICLGFYLITVYTYAGYRGDLTDAFCKLPIDQLGLGLAYIGWTGIMTLRVCAIWRQHRILVRVIRTLWACLICVVIVTLSLAYKEISSVMAYNTESRVCIPQGRPRLMGSTPMAPAIYELFLTILTLIKGFDFGRDTTYSTMPLLFRIFARDGVVYFVASAIINIISLVAWFGLQDSQLYLTQSFYWAVMSALMARMVLNLRVAHYRSMLEQYETRDFTRDLPLQSPSRSGGSRYATGEGTVAIDTMDPVSGTARGQEAKAPNGEVFLVPLRSMNPTRQSMGGGESARTDGTFRRRSIVEAPASNAVS